MMKNIICFLISVYLACPLFAQSPKPIVLQNVTDLLLVGKQTYFLEDKTAKLTIEDIQKIHYQEKFAQSKTDVFARPASHSAYWFKIVMQNHTEEDAWLEAGSVFLWYIDFYAVDEAGKVLQKVETGVLRPYKNKLQDVTLFWLPLNKAKDRTSKTYYLRIHTERAMEAPLEVGTLRALHKQKEVHDFIATSFLGAIFIMILYNLFVFFSVRDKLYLIYVAYLLSLFFVLPFNNNYPFFDGIEIGFITKNWWHAYMLVWQCCAFFLASYFSLHYLRLYERLRWMYWVAILQLYVWGLVIPLLRLAGVPHVYLALPQQYFLLFSTFTLISASYYLLFKGYKEAYYYALGWTFLVICLVLYLATINGLIGFNPILRDALYFGTALEVWMFSLALGDRYNAILKENEKLIIEKYQSLEKKVHERTEALETAYQNLQAANTDLQKNEDKLKLNYEELTAINENLMSALTELKDTQEQLILSEKMASIGQLVAGIAHEINNPLGAIRASNHNIAHVLETSLAKMPTLFQKMTAEMQVDFQKLIVHGTQTTFNMSSKEDRQMRREWRDFLSDKNIKDIDTFAENLVEANLRITDYPTYQHLLSIENAEENFKVIGNFIALFKSSKIIHTSVERAGKIVFALKKISHTDTNEQMSETDIQETIETVLTLYQNQIKKGIELKCNFQTIPKVLGFADELSQVWTNIIHNAMQAMDYKGLLEISIEQINDNAVVSVKDTGKGIPPELKEKIFETFFTTKIAGEGTGLGLSITKKIIEKHQGRIEVESEVGVGTTFKVLLPIQPTS